MTKLEKILFYAFLFLIPFQIRTTISWQGSEWDSIFLYLTDLLLIGFLFFTIINTKLKGLRFKKSDLFLALFFVVAIFSVFISSDKTTSIFHLIKLLEFIALYIYIMYRKEFLGLEKILKIIVFSGIFQSILAIAQFFKQSSLGLKFIEAGVYSPGAPGVATFIMGSEKVMRAYGSFPHPNVLAAFLLLAIFCFYYLFLRDRFTGTSGKGVGTSGTRYPGIFPRLPDILIYFLLIFGLFLTFSRGPILIFLIISFLFLIIRLFQLRPLYHTEERLLAGKRLMILSALFVVSSLISVIVLSPYIKARFFTLSLQEEAIDLRFFYNKMALSIIKDKPFLGIGIGNFVNFSHNYPVFLRAANAMLAGGGGADVKIPEWVYQPVHNLYLSIASEIGILGALLFLFFLAKTIIRPIRLISPIGFLFLGFLILALSDHLFWTLQSGGLMFWLVLGLIGPHSLTDRAQPSGG